MFDKLIYISLKNRLIVVGAAVILMTIGVIVAVNLPVDVFPDLTAPSVTIITEAHSMAAEEVETLVTFPIETAVNGATQVRRVRSSSTSGISFVWVEFDWGMNIFTARQIVAEKLQMVSGTLPEGVEKPVMAPITSIMGEIMIISTTIDSTLADKSAIPNSMELRSFVDWTLRRRLLSIPGVAQVIIIGGDVKQYQVLISPEKLAVYDIGINEVLRAAEELNMNSSGGVLRTSGQEYLIRGVGRVGSIDDISQSVITVRNGVPVLLGDVAEVKIGSAVKFGEGSANASPAVVTLVQKQPNANTLELTGRIDATVNDIRATMPPGIDIDTTVFRQADFIHVAINNVIEALQYGAIMVIVVLLLFLGNVRTTIISVFAIPLSLAVTILVFRFFDITINTMTLGGMAIAIGALVDDAIIDVENVYRRLREYSANKLTDTRSVIEVIYDASREIRWSMTNATFIIIIVFFPLFFLSGVEGRLLRPMGFAYVTSILASLLVALTVIPALCYFLLPLRKFKKSKSDSWIASRLKGMYRAVLDQVIVRSKMVFGLSLILLVATLAVLPLLGRSFLPEFNEGALTLSVMTLPGTSLPQSDAIGKLVEEIILDYPEVKSTVRRTGRAELDEHGQGVHGAEVDVRFELKDRNREEFLNELRNSLAIVPGTNITIGQPIGHRIDHMLSGTRANIAVKVFGADLYRLRTISSQIQDQMTNIPGIVDLAIEQQIDVPQIRITFNRRAMARYGMTVGELSEAIDVAFNGERVSTILEGQRSYDLVVRFQDANRNTFDSIKNALFDTPTGPMVPLDQLADISYDLGPNTISRENAQRKMVVQANIAERDLRSVINDVRQAVDNNIELPDGYYVEFGGQFESEQAAARTLTLLSTVSLVLIFFMLYLQFRTVKTSLFILANLPLALIGGVWAVYFTSGIVSIASLVGFITLFGIATRNGIMMISHIRYLQKEGKPFRDAIVQGAIERLNPILMTALTTGLALIPLALGGGAPGKEIETPMAIVILGGLFTSTLLNMVVVPTLYYRYEKQEIE